MSDQVAVQELSVVDGAHDFGKPRQRFAGGLQGSNQCGDDRTRARAGNPGKPIAGRGQRVYRSDQSDAPDSPALTDQVDARSAHEVLRYPLTVDAKDMHVSGFGVEADPAALFRWVAAVGAGNDVLIDNLAGVGDLAV